MTEEELVKKANEFINKDIPEIDAIFDNLGDIRLTQEQAETMIELLKKVFIYGAKSRIESLWHYPAKGELPEVFGKYVNEHYQEIPCLCKMVYNDYYVRYWNVKEQCFDTEDADDYFCGPDKVAKWLYIDELGEY